MKRILQAGLMLTAVTACSKASDSNGKEGTTGTAASTTTATSTATATGTATSAGTGGTPAGTLALSTIEGLPSVLDPVLAFDADNKADEAVAAAAFDRLAVETELTTLAETGASLGRKVSDLNAAFEAAETPSKAMCDTVNATMKFVFEAGSPDKMACVIKVAGLSDDESLYTGVDKVYLFNVSMEGKAMRYLMKLNVSRKDGVIDRFAFHSCGENGGWKQQQWFEQKFAAGKMTIESKMSGPEGSLSSLSLSAPIDANGKLRGLKTMSYRDTHVEKKRFKTAEITQSPANILYIGTEGPGSGSGNQIYSFFELLDANVDGEPYAITKLAVGDGAALVQQGGAEAILQGWNGDTFSINSEEGRLAKVEGMSGELLPALTEGVAPYSGAETFDCDTTNAVEVSVDASAVMSCMSRFEIDQDGESFCSGLGY